MICRTIPPNQRARTYFERWEAGESRLQTHHEKFQAIGAGCGRAVCRTEPEYGDDETDVDVCRTTLVSVADIFEGQRDPFYRNRRSNTQTVPESLTRRGRIELRRPADWAY